MRRSSGFQVFNMVFKERYREPTLELVLPTMLVSNIFLSAFYERGAFSVLGIVLAMIPIISVSETLAFSIGLRNVVFVTGDHLYKGSIISFITTPVTRGELFAFIYFSDVVVPILLWTLTTELYSLLSGIAVPPPYAYLCSWLFPLRKPSPPPHLGIQEPRYLDPRLHVCVRRHVHILGSWRVLLRPAGRLQ